MRSWLRYIALGSVFYLVFLVALFPAAQAHRLAAGSLTRALPALKLAQLEGTVWSGRAGVVAYRQTMLGQATWQASPFALLIGKASLTALLQNEHGYLQSRVAAPLTGGSVNLSAVEGRLPVMELARFAPYLPVVLEGVVSLDLPSFVVDSTSRIVAAEGKVIWHQAGMSSPQQLVLGDLQLSLHTEGEQVVGDISDGGGPLKVNGALQLSPDGGYRINGTVSAAPDAPATLVQSLGWLGKPDAQGHYRLNYSGRL